ncbi:MAG: type IV toxin-antitoxin system AbiEi family antitoxin domain-containing protein [Deltaproteobacteria bacterium]|nr:type IV toxin-antitoxin system AbiEi family antitoxin domain-containing protein [Deltaproteobacteria bacterium]
MLHDTEWDSDDDELTARAREAAARGVPFRAGNVGVPTSILSRMVKQNELRRLGRGVYIASDVELHPLAEAAAVCLRVPRAVVCLRSALEYHDLTTAWADGIWVMVPRDRNPPKDAEARLHVIRVQPKYLQPDLGIVTLDVHGVPMRLTNPLRTVIDCWRYPRRIPHSTAHESLRELHRSPHWNGREFYNLAKALEVWKRLRPYVEGLQ